LDRTDVDLKLGILHIRRTKFGKSRYVPVHPSTVRALKNSAEARDRFFPARLVPAFFISEQGRRITEWIARYTFAKLSQRIGLRAGAKGHGRGPRLQDMRHRFAARTLIRWYRSGLDAQRELPKLSTYLGHVHVNDTHWYLSRSPGEHPQKQCSHAERSFGSHPFFLPVRGVRRARPCPPLPADPGGA